MKLFEKIFKKRKSNVVAEDLIVEIETTKNLTKQQRDAITKIVTRGILNQSSLSDISIAIIMEAAILDPVIMTKEQNHIKVRI